MNSLLSTHANRQGVDTSVTVCFVCVCTVTDFSVEDKASGNKFCWSVYRRPRQGITYFGNFAPPEAQNQTNWPARVQPAHMFGGQRVVVVSIGSACVDIDQSPLTYLFTEFDISNKQQLVPSRSSSPFFKFAVFCHRHIGVGLVHHSCSVVGQVCDSTSERHDSGNHHHLILYTNKQWKRQRNITDNEKLLSGHTDTHTVTHTYNVDQLHYLDR